MLFLDLLSFLIHTPELIFIFSILPVSIQLMHRILSYFWVILYFFKYFSFSIRTSSITNWVLSWIIILIESFVGPSSLCVILDVFLRFITLFFIFLSSKFLILSVIPLLISIFKLIFSISIYNILPTISSYF